MRQRGAARGVSDIHGDVRTPLGKVRRAVASSVAPLLLAAGLSQAPAVSEAAETPAQPAQNLQYFVASQGPFVQFRGFVEPMNPSVAVRPRMYLLPEIRIERATFRKKTGEIAPVVLPLRPADFSDVDAVTYVVRLDQNIPATEAYRVAIARALEGRGGIVRAKPPVPTIGNQDMTAEFSKWTAEYQVDAARMDAYEVTSVLPVNLSIAVNCEGETLAAYASESGAAVSNGSTFMVTVKHPRAELVPSLMQGECTVTAGYEFNCASFRAGEVSLDQSFYGQALVSAVRSQLTSRTSGSTGFLFMKSVHSSVSTQIRETVNKQLSTSMGRQMSIVTRDLDDAELLAEFRAQFCPEIAVDAAAKLHEDAAKAESDPALRALHLRYAAALRSGDGSAETDVLGALAALSQGNFAGFIAKGLRVSDESGRASTRAACFYSSSVQASSVDRINKILMRSVNFRYMASMPASQFVGQQGFRFDENFTPISPSELSERPAGPMPKGQVAGERR